MRIKRKAIFWRGVGIVLALLLLGLGVRTWVVHAQLNSEIALAKAEGIPLTYAELPVHPMPPVSENAAPEYEAALAAYKAAPALLPFKYGQSKAEDRRQAHGDFVNHRKAVELFFSATAKPHCEFGYVFPFDDRRHMANLGGIKSLLKIVVGEAQAEADEGHPGAGLSLLYRIAPVTEHEAESATGFSVLTAATSVSIVCRALQTILDGHGREPGVAEAAPGVIRRCRFKVDLVGVLEANNVEFLDPLQSGTAIRAVAGYSSPRVVTASYAPGMVEQWRDAAVHAIRDQVRIVRSSSGDWVKLDRDLSASFTTASRGISGIYLDELGIDPAYFVTQISGAITNRRVTEQAAAVLLEWNRTGKLPAALPLKGENATDPRTNRTLQYVVSSNKFKIYGAGSRGVDHGGDLSRDVVFAYPTRLSLSAQDPDK